MDNQKSKHMNATKSQKKLNNLASKNGTKPSFKNLPKGADALLIALNTPAPNNHWGIPVLLWGKPGMGKSSFIESLARPDFPVVTLIASLHDPTDFSGLPVFKDDRVHFARPEWMDAFAATGQGILFLDELTTAPPAVQAALLRVVLERRVGFHKLPDGVRIVAAANPPEMNHGWELSLPLRNRFLHIEWELTPSVFINGQVKGFPKIDFPSPDLKRFKHYLEKIKKITCAFLKEYPDTLYKESAEDQSVATPRSWEFAQRLLATSFATNFVSHEEIDIEELRLELLKGTLGKGVALNFYPYFKNAYIMDPEEILSGKIVMGKLSEDQILTLFHAFESHIKKSSGSLYNYLPSKINELYASSTQNSPKLPEDQNQTMSQSN